MGLFSGISDIANKVTGGVFNPFSDSGFLGQFSGQSQQDDANRAAMASWNLMNDYNHPLQQMARLKAAGLNPLLVYGSGSVTGNTTSAPNLVGGTVSTPLETAVKLGSKALSAMQGMATLDQTYATTAAQTAAAGASGAQAANLNAQAAINNIRAGLERKSLIADIDYKEALAAKTEAEASLAQGEAEIFGAVGGSKGAQAAGSGLKGFGKFVRGIVGR